MEGKGEFERALAPNADGASFPNCVDARRGTTPSSIDEPAEMRCGVMLLEAGLGVNSELEGGARRDDGRGSVVEWV